MDNNELDNFEEELNLGVIELEGNAELPNSTTVLVLGILSIPCCCFSIVSVILSIIALVLAKKDLDKYYLNSRGYSEKSYKNLKAGKVCAIIGLVLGSLTIVSSIVQLIIGGITSFENLIQ